MPTNNYTGATGWDNGSTHFRNSLDTSYAAAHDTLAGQTSATIIWVEQNFTGTYYNIARIPLMFDTSNLGTASLISATLTSGNVAEIYRTDGDDDIVLVEASGLHKTGFENDYGLIKDFTTNCGEVNTSGMSVGNPYVITLNAAGLAAISKTGETQFALRLAKDISATAPTARLYVRTGLTSSVGFILSVTYTLLSVQTDPATNITPNSAQLNGTLVEDGDDTPVQCNFQWGLTTSYGNETLAETVAESASYSKVIGANLTPGTTYHFRAKAVGTSGATVYGADRTFAAATPSESLARVTGLVHYFQAGPRPIYQLEIIRGGLSSQYFSPIEAMQPTPTIPTERAKTGEEAVNWMRVMIQWEATHTQAEQVKELSIWAPGVNWQKRAITLNEWIQWYKWKLASGQGF